MNKMIVVAMSWSVVLAACGGDPGPSSGTGAPADATPGGDAGAEVPADTGGPKKDSAPLDDALGGCPDPVPEGYVCGAASLPAAAKACSDEDLAGVVKNCFHAGGDCPGWRAAHAACDACVAAWVHPTLRGPYWAACYKAIDKASDCGRLEHCAGDCLKHTCYNGSCSTDAEARSCEERVLSSGGACATALDLTKWKACQADPQFLPCRRVENDAGLIQFYRGACRDGGDWSLSATPKG